MRYGFSENKVGNRLRGRYIVYQQSVGSITSRPDKQTQELLFLLNEMVKYLEDVNNLIEKKIIQSFEDIKTTYDYLDKGVDQLIRELIDENAAMRIKLCEKPSKSKTGAKKKVVKC